MRAERVEKALHFDISQGDDVPMTISTGVQAEAQTNSYGVQAEAQTRSSGTQSSTTRLEDSETQTRYVRTKGRGSQATEDRFGEIEQVRRASELGKQALIDQHAQNVERIRQQVMAEGEAAHSRMKEGYKQEALDKLQMNTEGAKRAIQQVQQQAQQEAQQCVGSVVNYAEQAHK